MERDCSANENKSLFKFQQDTVNILLSSPDKHIVYATMGCLAKGTPVRLANGLVKPVEQIKSGDVLLSFDEKTGELVPNAVSDVVMSCDQPKPMIELCYDGERITTTYDHYFYSEDGYAPLYQLVWGTLETSQRLQLQLLCKQYGQNCDDNLFWRKRSWNNEARQERQVGASKDSNGRQKCCSPSSYRGNLVEKPVKVALRKPHQFRSVGQQSRKSGVLLKEIQCVSWLSYGEYKETSDKEHKKSPDKRRTERNQRVLSTKHDRNNKQSREEETLRKALQEISNSRETANTKVRNWSVKIKLPAPYYSICMCQAPYTYCIGRKHNYLVHNTGKTATSMVWAQAKCLERGLNKVLVITTASKSKTKDSLGRNDFELEADDFCTPSFRQNLGSFETVSWNSLHKWVDEHRRTIREWVIVADELQRIKGWTTRMGRAFLKISMETENWVGFTGTPGDYWISYGAYFQACRLVRNKTHFMRQFCIVQTFKGFPEIVGYLNESTLKAWWAEISYAPDTSRIAQELPKATHKVIHFPKPKGYDKVLKMRQKLCEDGTLSEDYENFLDNPSKTFHYLRQLCFTKEKQQWVADFIEGLGENCIFFYNYTATADTIEKIAKKVLPKGAKVWRIDGSHHQIPTKDTIGKYDIVLSQWQSGSEGLNLYFMRTWVSAELTYSYSVAQQARGRVLRHGQERPVFFYYLQTAHTIEEDIMTCLKGKGEFSEKVWMLGNGLMKEKSGH